VLKNPHAVLFQLRDLGVGVWCVLSALKIKGPVFFEETIHSYSYNRLYTTLFFRKWAEEKIYDYFTDDKTTAHIPTSK
jgi:hypothetical protein